jgi:uncharacterized protein (UPF0335 family)
MTDILTGPAQTQLATIIERLERLAEEAASLRADMKEVFAEAKGNGFDTKIIRKILRRRATDAAKLQEEEALIDLYSAALGDLPLFRKAA